jgi:hypothetical protein
VGPKSIPRLVELRQGEHKLLDRAGEPVETPHDDHIVSLRRASCIKAFSTALRSSDCGTAVYPSKRARQMRLSVSGR